MLKRILLALSLCLATVAASNTALATCYCEYTVLGVCNHQICLPSGWIQVSSCGTPAQYHVNIEDSWGYCYGFSVQSGPMNITDTSPYQNMSGLIHVWAGANATILLAQGTGYSGTHIVVAPSTNATINFAVGSLASHSQ